MRGGTAVTPRAETPRVRGRAENVLGYDVRALRARRGHHGVAFPVLVAGIK